MENFPAYKITTLGCKVNRYESDRIKSRLSEFGFREAGDDEVPDVHIVNTCAVTREAARKSRQMGRKYLKDGEEPLVYAIGCAAEMPEYALSNLPESVYFITNEQKEELPEIIAERFGLKKIKSAGPLTTERTRAFLKVQDGCNNFCSYCIIPYLRGRSRSRQPGEIIEELIEIEKAGFPEVVLTGIHLGDYGSNLEPHTGLTGLVDLILKKTSIPRVRLSSLEPMDFSYDLLELFTRDRRLCRHLHLPLQHGTDKILKMMRRNYSMEEYDSIVRTAVEKIPGMTISTDVMVGFPGETDEDFGQMYGYLKNAPIPLMHVFPFSSHKMTAAAKFEGIVPSFVKKDRLRKLVDLRSQKIEKYFSEYLGKTVEVLPERVDNGMLQGHTDNYLPVKFPGSEDSLEKILKVKICSLEKEVLYGENHEPLRPRGGPGKA